jgi:hypothetical protein
MLEHRKSPIKTMPVKSPVTTANNDCHISPKQLTNGQMVLLSKLIEYDDLLFD